MTAPPAGAVSQAKDLLRRLGALNADGHLTDHGRRMAELPLHPRLSHMLLKSVELHCTDLACDLAALLSERDVVQGPSNARPRDLRLRLDALHGNRDHIGGVSIDRGSIHRVKRTADLWRRELGGQADKHQATTTSAATDRAGLLLALAYPDRIAQRQTGIDARYLLANGRGALFANPDPLVSEPYLVIAELDAGSQWARIDLAAPVLLADIERLYRDQIVETETVTWDERTKSVRASRQRRLGALILSEKALSKPDASSKVDALLEGVRQAGLAALAWTPELKQWQARVQLLRRMDGPESDWPDVSDETLTHTLSRWLGPALDGITTLDRVKRLDLSQPLHTLLTWKQHRDLDRLAPTHVTVPSGSKIRIDYDSPDLPVLAVRLQEMFGCLDTPRVAGGKMPVMLHLLSPAKRPVQVTKDLASFWRTAYQEVRKELRGRYPKHHWPEDPLTAPPTAKGKRHRP